MSTFVPGQFRQKLQEKIKTNPDPDTQDVRPFQIKNTDPSTFARPASAYTANEMKQLNQSVRSPAGTASLPKGSIMQKSVHERMQTFVAQQFAKK